MNTWIKLAGVVAVQAVCVAAGVAPQLSARTTGEEYLLRVEPADPIDPFRGAYVALGYPDIDVPSDQVKGDTVFVTLVEEDGVWVQESFSTTRPASGPYLMCDAHSWNINCGIDSYFLPQDDAAHFDQLVRDGKAVATIRIDGRGHAAIVGLGSR